MKIRKLSLLIIVLAVLLAACGKKGDPLSEGENTLGPETAETQETTDPEVILLTENDSGKEADAEAGILPEQMYGAFLSGEMKVRLVPQNEFFSMLGEKSFLTEEALTLPEYQERIAGRIRQEWYLEEPIDGTAEYAWLDPGNSGRKLLAVQMHFPVEAEEWIVYLVVAAEGEELKECFSIDAYYRKGVSISSKGVVSSGGSNGATSHTYEQFFIDSNGRPHFLYGVNTEYNPVSFYWNGAFVNLPDSLYQDRDAELLEYYFEPDPDEESIRLLVLGTSTEDRSEHDIPDHPIREALEKEGILLTPAADAGKRIEEREKEAGYDRSMDGAPEPEWIPING